MNFIEEFKKGQTGGNKGLPMGKGLQNLSKHINGVQRSRIYGVASPPKTGKSTFVDFGFVIQPYLYYLEYNVKVNWIYYSFEIDRISKEFDFATYFLYHDYGITEITLPEGITRKGQKVIELSPDYLRGRVLDDNETIITVNNDILDKLKTVYNNRIVPLFGSYDTKGNLMTKGLITFVEEKDNPTGIRKSLMFYAEQNGIFIKQTFGTAQRIVGYKPNDPEKYVIIIMDHLRKLIPERGFQMKQTVDKMIEYMVELRNWCGYTFVPIIHTNRNLASVDRIKAFSSDELYPTSEDIKDTGNLAEDADYVFTLFNPNDPKYKLKSHFKITLHDGNNNEIYPYFRTIHLVESRHCEFPRHFSTEMLGNIKSFRQIQLKFNNG